MFDPTNQAVIFQPMLLVMALTFVAFFNLAFARAKVAKAMPADYYRAQIGDPEPEQARAAARHYDNTLELPTVFYAACLVAYVLGAAGSWTLVFAWAYALMRLVQSLIHISYNNPMHRGLAFGLGTLALLAMCLNVALGVFANT